MSRPAHRVWEIVDDVRRPLLWAVGVRRPDDLFAATFAFYNLRVVGSPPTLRRTDAARPAHVVLELPPQSFLEEALLDATGPEVTGPPHRGVSITRTRVVRQRQVRVFGHRPEESAGHREAFDHRVPMPDPGRPGQTRLVTPSDIARTTVVEVWVETLDPGASEDFGWRRDEGAPVVPAAPTAAAGRPAGAEAARARDLHARREFTLLAREGLAELVEDWATLWGGTVTLPADAPAGTRHRLVVAEYEEHLVDDETPYDMLLHRKGRRLVFVEHVALA
jgi:hypothetical protein